jgi:hypothetical protein
MKYDKCGNNSAVTETFKKVALERLKVNTKLN